MPTYEYEHENEGCELGSRFEIRQSIHDAALAVCPTCGRPVRRLISAASVHSVKGNSELRDLGFTKLVRRGDGTYENVTARKGEPKTVRRDSGD